MKKLFSFIAVICFATTASAQYQVGNSDFETTWTDTNEPGNGWYSFVSGTGDQATLGIPFSKGNTTKVDGRNGGNAVQIKSSSILGKKANGNLTTGRINLGSTTPADASNYNFTDRSANTNKCVFSGRPDKLEYWAKFTRGGSANNGRCHAIIHGAINYRDPNETTANVAQYKIAEATVYATPCTNWTKFEGELEYTGVKSETSYLLATFTTNETPGGSSGDVFVIDDIMFIYYSQLKSLTIDGVSVPNFNKDTYNYSVDSYYIEGTTVVDAVDNTKAGVATIASSYDGETAKFTIVVTNQEGSESHTYTIQFRKRGDVNKDGGVTIADVTTLVNMILGKDEQNALADVNKDGGVTIADVTTLVNIILGKN